MILLVYTPSIVPLQHASMPTLQQPSIVTLLQPSILKKAINYHRLLYVVFIFREKGAAVLGRFHH
jgi:hypothetical protein